MVEPTNVPVIVVVFKTSEASFHSFTAGTWRLGLSFSSFHTEH